MLQKIPHNLLRHRHYWRDVGFDELSELYVSMLFRSIGMSLIGIFIPVYLYNHGIEIPYIFMFYAIFFGFMSLFSPWAAMVIARIGPKHTMAYSYLVQIAGLGMLASYNVIAWPLWLIAVVIGIANTLFFLAFHVDFPKVKHRDHGGKEVGWLIIVERAGAVAGPIIGGLVAYWFGAQYTFFAAMLMFAIGVIPLFLTSEPVRIHQTISVHRIKLRDIRHTLLSVCSFNIDTAVMIIVWPMFVSIFVFKENPYLQLGAITSIGVIISILSARTIGGLIDMQKGRLLLRVGSTLHAVIQLFRPFVSGFMPAIAVNMSSEMATSASRIPYLKGMYDEADEKEGARILYFTILEVFTTMARAIFFFVATLISIAWTDKNAFLPLFIIGSLASLLIMTERFRALKPR